MQVGLTKELLQPIPMSSLVTKRWNDRKRREKAMRMLKTKYVLWSIHMQCFRCKKQKGFTTNSHRDLSKYVVSWQDLCERSTFNMEADRQFFYGKTGPVTMRWWFLTVFSAFRQTPQGCLNPLHGKSRQAVDFCVRADVRSNSTYTKRNIAKLTINSNRYHYFEFNLYIHLLVNR
jgi:hypothetical protein